MSNKNPATQGQQKNSLKKIQQKISRTQILLIISLSLILALVGVFINIRSEREKIDRNLQNIAETISTSPTLTEKDIQNGVSGEQDSLTSYLDALKKSLEDVDVISIVNSNNTRFYHTNHSLIGTEYDGEQPSFDESKRFYIVDTSGPSGAQRRAYSALYDSNGNYLGFIMVIILTEHLNANLSQIIITYTLITIAVIAVELFISSWLSKNIKKSLLGYEPDVISAMYLVRDNILESLEEGIVAIDKQGKILFINSPAVEILNKENAPADINLIGKNIDEIENGSIIKRALIGEERELNIHEQSFNELDILIDRIPIKAEDEIVGTIGILHNRTEYTKLMEDLSGTRYLVDSMRANNHDFTNKLHVILGLIQMQMYEQATEYIENITMVQRSTISKIMNTVGDPALAALLIGKSARAAELNVKFVLREGSYYSTGDMPLPSEVLITVVGNLIENAFESMNEKDNTKDTQKELLFGIYSKPNAVLITVDDTGLGIAPNDLEHIFENGYSTKGENRGTGLFQVKTMVDNLGGQITVESQINVGTSFSVSFSK
ncbi:MAG: Spo0B domain-containing protein [Clostridia bacterium]|nr:Spo0B domain-containing protein [Clostridia bacterium]